MFWWWWDQPHVLECVASFADVPSLARLVCSCSSIDAAAIVRYIAPQRKFRTLEQVALAAALDDLFEIRFRYHAVGLQASTYDALAVFARVINRHTCTVAVEGHCGLEEAPRARGFHFTRERATAVMVALVDLGVDSHRITIAGHSHTRPVVWQVGDDEGAPNRRVELFVQCDGVEIPDRRKPPMGDFLDYRPLPYGRRLALYR